MARQDSKRGIQITTAVFEAAFETHITRFGVKGLDLANAPDSVESGVLSRMTNVTHRQDFALTSRPGMTSFGTTTNGFNIHSIRRLNDPLNGTFSRVVGGAGHLFQGTTGALTQIDTGYSGDPLWMVPYRPPQSAQTWMYVADRLRMRKVRADGLYLPIGLPKPTNPPTAVLGTEGRTDVCSFSLADNTEAAQWLAQAGTEVDDVGVVTGAGTTVDHGTGTEFLTNAGAANDPFYNFWGIHKNMDLSTIANLAVDSDDDDLIHLTLTMSHPQYTAEVRLYFVCADNFNPAYLPGTDPTGFSNTDAYVKSFRGNDLATYIFAQKAAHVAAEEARIRRIRDESLRAQSVDDNRDSWAERRASVETSRQISFQGPTTGFIEYGEVGLPLRKGDFQRIGQTAGRDWSNITGVIVYIHSTTAAGVISFSMGDCFLRGGAGPDTSEPGFAKYDWRYTNYDPRTGTEGNPSETMVETNHLDPLRRSVGLTPTAFGDAAVRQRFYRRGGSLPTDWFYLGQNSSDGGVFTDDYSDFEVEASATLDIDNYQPVATVDANGDTVLAQSVPALWGPLDDLLFACGDKYRPGHIYFCKRGNPDSWPADYSTEVCSPSEELMAGCLFGGQSFVFSKERLFVLYPNVSSTDISVTSSVTQCKKGMMNRWGLAVGIGGMFFVASDGIYRTLGGPEEWLSKDIDPLFRGKTVNGLAPIDLTADTKIRLEIFENELYFSYQDQNGDMQCLVGSLVYQFWRHYSFGQDVSCFARDEGPEESSLIIGGLTSGKLYQHEGFNDDGTAIDCLFRTGWNCFGTPRQEKRLGDQFLDIDTQGVEISLTNRLNDETVTNPANLLNTSSGRSRATFDGFGTTPQRVRNLSAEVEWSSSSAAPIVYQLGTSIIIEPEFTINRVTQWEDLGHADESYLTGVTFDCDTGGDDRQIIVEYDFNGSISTAATLNVNCNGRHKIKFSWPAVQAHKVRIRPNDDCAAWILYKADWIAQPEPPRIAAWDTFFENSWDAYYTGLDLFCDTNGQTKTIEVYVDGALVKTESVVTTGRRVHHITLPWGRGHIFRFKATDQNPGLLYEYRWHLEAEPSEQANWNQNFTVAGTEGDKYLKAVVFQCDTYGQTKTVTVECDGVVVETLGVNSNGRKVVQMAFPQHLGRVFRIYPTDGNPGRLYSLWWVFDQEPLCFDRWETQEITHGLSGWHYPIFTHLTIKSTSDVNLQVTAYNQSGVAIIQTYNIPSTEGVKIKQFVGFKPTKGVLYKYVLTSINPFWLYREETIVKVREWGSERTIDAHIFGNDNTDQTRTMAKSELSAARGGGTAS